MQITPHFVNDLEKQVIWPSAETDCHHVKQLVIRTINSATSQTSRGRVADMTVLCHQYCADLAGTTNKVYHKYP